MFLRFWDPVDARMITLRSTFAFSFQACVKAGDGDSNAGPRCECEWLVCVWAGPLTRAGCIPAPLPVRAGITHYPK